MTIASYLYCDSCGRTLAIPAIHGTAKRWLRLSVNDRHGDLVFRHVCGECDHTALIRRMEMM